MALKEYLVENNKDNKVYLPRTDGLTVALGNLMFKN